ncbi:MAG: hypothetical protein HFH63_09535 [Lachnospiraceae bacterium]|nr:hypothetical protein [Lachnospiraceae bacterium]
MSNQARNIIKKSTLNYKQKKLKEYRGECRYEFGNILPLIPLALAFFIVSLTNNSIDFSSFLAIFSNSLTLSFERAEWKNLHIERSYQNLIIIIPN